MKISLFYLPFLTTLTTCCLALPAPARCNELSEILELRAMERFAAASEAMEHGQVDDARRELSRLVDDMPYTEGARRAFVLARDVYRGTGGSEAESEFLLQVASRLSWVAEPGAALHAGAARMLLAEALVEVGRIRLLDHGRAEGAVRMLARALPVARGTPWEDDALIWMARALREQSRFAEALGYYDELIRTQQAAWFFGVYLSPYYDDALYEVGQTLECQQRLEDAEAAYDELFKRAPMSGLLESAGARLRMLRERLHTAHYPAHLQAYDVRHMALQ